MRVPSSPVSKVDLLRMPTWKSGAGFSGDDNDEVCTHDFHPYFTIRGGFALEVKFKRPVWRKIVWFPCRKAQELDVHTLPYRVAAVREVRLAYMEDSEGEY